MKAVRFGMYCKTMGTQLTELPSVIVQDRLATPTSFLMRRYLQDASVQAVAPRTESMLLPRTRSLYAATETITPIPPPLKLPLDSQSTSPASALTNCVFPYLLPKAKGEGVLHRQRKLCCELSQDQALGTLDVGDVEYLGLSNKQIGRTFD